MQSFLFFFSRHTSKRSDLVQKQLTGTVAVLLKRGWVDESPEERHAFFSEVESTVAGTNDADARRTGIEILEVSVLAYKNTLLTACMHACKQPDILICIVLSVHVIACHMSGFSNKSQDSEVTLHVGARSFCLPMIYVAKPAWVLILQYPLHVFERHVVQSHQP